ncbi:MAG: type I DNA topoisomerase [Planctomycetes bacterium]|nr:type I DNA topoisomerase [Planctomycetota bacterium]
MSKPLVIVESPAKARTIGKFLGSAYTVKASMGHVRDLPKSGLAIDVENGFDLTWAPIPDREKVLKDLRERIAHTDTLYLATDPDREGEAIAWHLVEALLDEKSREKIDIKRVVFHEITNSAIKEAFDHPSDVNQSRVDAYRTRRILDRLMGYQLSPLLWKKLARGLSAGRVQSVAVRLVAEREREIRAFTPEEYWRIVARFGEGDDAFEAEFARLDGEKFALTDAQRAGTVLERLLRGTSLEPALFAPEQLVATADDPHPERLTAYYEPLRDVDRFFVTKLEQKARVDRPKPPFITSTLQQAAASRYGFAAKRTMRVAQQLYEGIDLPGEGAVGLITYMRTDSVAISNQARDAAAKLVTHMYGERYLPEKPNLYRSKKGAQEAHEAIRPTDPERLPERLRSALSDEQAKLYDLIWRRFMASQMAPAESLVTTVELTREGASFDATGRVTTFDGYARVWGRDKDGDQQLPEMAEGLQLTANEVPATQHFTTPPRRYTEASLVRALEKHGIGRPSTYASILSTIVDRRYVDHGEEASEDEARRQYLAFGDVAPDAAAIAAAEAERESSDDDDEAPVDRADRRQRKSRAFHATHLGEVVTDLLLPYFGEIVDTEFTANMESQLDQIAEGEIPWLKVVDDFYSRFAVDLKTADQDMTPYWQRPLLLTDMKCGKVPEDGGPPCEAPMAILFNKFGAYLGCSRYPDCKNTMSLTGRPKAAAELTEFTCRKRNDAGVICGRPMERKVNRWGSAFLACTGFKSKDCDGSVSLSKSGEPLWPEETSVPCPDCGALLVVKRSRRGKFLACPRFPKCRGTLSLPTCTHESKTGKPCGKPMTEPVAGGKMACPTHPGVKLEPPKKVRADDAAAKGAASGGDRASPKAGRSAGGKKATTRKTTRKATTKKAVRKKPVSE